MSKKEKELIKKLEQGNLTEEEMIELTQEMSKVGLSGIITGVEDINSPEGRAAKEYVEYHKKLPSQFFQSKYPQVSEKEVEKASKKLLSSKSSLRDKKKAIILLAHTGRFEALHILEKYAEKPDKELKVWINMAIDECRTFLESNISEKPVISFGKATKVGRNDPCPCGKINPETGKPIKYKKCCGGSVFF